MKHLQRCLLAGLLLFGMAANAQTNEEAKGAVENDIFKEVAAAYRAAMPKPQLPEDARKFKVQAEFAVQEKRFDRAVELYGKALDIAPWWPEGHFNRALILGETKKYWDAIREMKRYLLLVPDASDARAAQDKIYVWDDVAGPETPLRFGVYGVSSSTNIWTGKPIPQPMYGKSFIEGGHFASAKQVSEDKCDVSSCDLIVKVTCSRDGGSPPAKATVISALSGQTLYTVTEGTGGWGSDCLKNSYNLGTAINQAFAPGTSLNKSVWAEKSLPPGTHINPAAGGGKEELRKRKIEAAF
jgi:tetratricopeptide (TPR) repeat protein